jgi:hypothetical protein
MLHTTARLTALLIASALFSACSAPKAPPPPVRAASAPAAGGASNALASAAGSAGAPQLDAAQRAELDATIAAAPAATRPRLRYALGAGDDGKPRLVVYDGEGLGPDGKHRGKPHEYVVFKVLNSKTGEHYDPQQNAVIAAIPPPPQREVSETVPK